MTAADKKISSFIQIFNSKKIIFVFIIYVIVIIICYLYTTNIDSFSKASLPSLYYRFFGFKPSISKVQQFAFKKYAFFTTTQANANIPFRQVLSNPNLR